MLTIIGVLEPTGLRAGSEGAAMMQRDLDLDVYFPLTLAHDVFGDTIVRQQAGTMERKQIELIGGLAEGQAIDDVERVAAMAENVAGIQQSGPSDLANGRGWTSR